MTMEHDTIKDRLLAGEDPATPGLASHLAGCPGCAEFARRLGLVRGTLRQPGGDVLPDPGFAARVMARLPRSADLLGWAALRALPAALLLALILAGLSAADIAPPASLLVDEPSSSQLLAWSAQAPGDLR
jgi:hypothetical protein